MNLDIQIASLSVWHIEEMRLQTTFVYLHWIKSSLFNLIHKQQECTKSTWETKAARH